MKFIVPCPPPTLFSRSSVYFSPLLSQPFRAILLDPLSDASPTLLHYTRDSQKWFTIVSDPSPLLLLLSFLSRGNTCIISGLPECTTLTRGRFRSQWAAAARTRDTERALLPYRITWKFITHYTAVETWAESGRDAFRIRAFSAATCRLFVGYKFSESSLASATI